MKRVNISIYHKELLSELSQTAYLAQGSLNKCGLETPEESYWVGVCEVKRGFMMILRYYLPFHPYSLINIQWRFPEAT